MARYTKTFVNEKGNEIAVEVWSNLEGITFTITGPNSASSNEITKIEADELLRGLTQTLIGKPEQ